MHDGIEHAGYLAFLGLLSFFPFLVFFVAIAGEIGEAQISAELAQEILHIMPEEMANVLRPRITEILSGPPQTLLTISIIGVIWTASSAVEGSRTILNRAYRVETPPAYIWRRLGSILQFLVLTAGLMIAMFVLILSPVIWSEISALLIKTGADFKEAEYYYNKYEFTIRYGFSALMLFLIVASRYYTLPNIKQRWRNVVPGTVLVMLGWLGSAELLSLYLQNFDQINLIYGSLGGIIGVLLFFYFSGIIYIFGAEFNYFLEKAMGHKMEEKIQVKKPKKKKKATTTATAKKG